MQEHGNAYKVRGADWTLPNSEMAAVAIRRKLWLSMVVNMVFYSVILLIWMMDSVRR